MTTPYLICHKVRGQAAFDIAIQLDFPGTLTDPGPWWIIPTSGHRAYPFWQIDLDYLYADDTNIVWNMPNMPSNLRDHCTYQEPKQRKLNDLTIEDLEI